MSVVYARLLPEEITNQACIILYGLAVDGRSVGAVTNKKVPGVKLEPSPLRLPMLHFGSSPSPSAVHENVHFSGNI